MAKILVVDDEEKMRHLLSIMLESNGYSVEQASDGVKALSMIEEGNYYDIVITDIKMPRMDGFALLKELKEKDIQIPVIFITAFATIDSAVEVMREGAVDYITKPFEEERIFLAVERNLKLSKIMAENKALKQEIRSSFQKDEIVYVSEKMADVMNLAGKVAESDSAVLISGESGTGKELLAKFIHYKSPRKEGRFVPVNCAAISQNLVESELFGHEKGAFTGADRRTAGKFEFASGGTLFLDEIGDLPAEAQAKMLRALQEKRIQRIGKNEEIPVDVRVICATNRNLSELVEREEFRKDLFFRINVFPLEPPPLRDRMEDAVPLFNHFLKRMCAGKPMKIDKSAEKVLMTYNWPGNVRELANAVERSVILCRDSGIISKETLSFLKSSETAKMDCTDFKLPPEGIALETLEKDIVMQALAASGNNQTAAAKLLGLSRAKFRVLLKQATALETD